jgi:hypothetical protein
VQFLLLQDLQGLLEHKALKEILELQVPLAHKELLATTAQLDRKAFRANKVFKVQ